MLVITDLCVDYDGVQALAGINLEVKQGEIVTLIGANGAGKTTTLKAISGLVKVRSGSIYYQGQLLNTVAPHQRLSLGIAHCPEGRHILQKQTVKENLELGAFIRSDRAAIAADMEKMFSLFPRLQERQNQLAGTMSGGEQQMLAIARALMSRPQLLLLDEPSLGLAPQIVQDIFRVIQTLKQ
ncbi:MAG: ABC transporter ATP-binding protein, partial [Pseudanabaenaceae cyanobacterium]